MTFKNILPKAFKYYILTAFVFFIFTNISAQNYEKQTIIIKLKEEHKDLFKNKSQIFHQDFDAINPLFKNTIRSKYQIENIYKIRLNNNISVDEACEKYKKSPYFEYCQANYLDDILYTPDDPKTSVQYVLSICQAFDAWEIHKGDSNIVIGVTDTGVDFDHEDLRKNIAYNTNDLIDGIDNDFDGYIDNYMGWDFGSGDNNPQWNESGTSGNAIHGTFTSGLAGARTDNGIGMSAFGFKTKFLPIKISDDNGSISTGYEAIIYAAQHGCDIINCSWGSTVPHEYGKDVIAYVTNVLDVIIVGAAGNENNEKLYYPASYDNVVSVAASNSSDIKWDNSSYNWRVDIIAPGEYVLSTLSNSTYGTSSGTSFAAPIVSASLALLKSYYPDSISNQQLIEILKNSGDKIDTSISNINYQNKIGKSRLNLYKALQSDLTPAIRSKNIQVLKNNAPAYAGDTAILSGIVTNYLLPTENLNINISSNSPYLSINNGTCFIQSLSENESINFEDFNIEMIIAPETPNYESIEILISYQSDNYTSAELRQFSITYPYLNVNNQRLNTSIFAEGKMGFGYSNSGEGLIIDQDENLLYEMGVIAGYDSETTISSARGYNDFKALTILDSSSTEQIWFANNTFYNTNILPIEIHAQYEFYKDTMHQNAFLIHYDLINKNNFDIENFHLGIFADWDIVHYSNNYTSIDTSLKLGLTHCFGRNEIAGIQILSNVPWHRYAFDNINGNNNLNSIDGLSREEFYTALSNHSHYVGIEENGTDVLDLLSGGPFIVRENDTLNLSFAIYADTSLQNIIQSATHVKAVYDSLHNITFNIKEISKLNDFQIYPTITKDYLHLKFQEMTLNKTISIFDLYGRIIMIEEVKESIIDVNRLSKGIYFLKLGNTSKKFIKE